MGIICDVIIIGVVVDICLSSVYICCWDLVFSFLNGLFIYSSEGDDKIVWVNIKCLFFLFDKCCFVLLI